MDGQELCAANRTPLIDGLTNNVDDSSESFGTNGNLNGVASVCDGLTTNETLSGVESNGAHVVATQMLGDLKDESVGSALDFERIHNGGKFTFELHVDDSTDDLGNFTSSGAETTYKTQTQSVTRGIPGIELQRREFATYAG